MIRLGIPPSLRCAVWISNIIQASHPHQGLSYAHEYRTLAKVQILDSGYQVLWDNNIIKQEDIQRVSFGHDESSLWEPLEGYAGKESLKNVLYALSFVLGGIEYAPLVPKLALLMLGFMSESYVFCSIREMAHNNTWYWASSQAEHIAYGRAFLDVLDRLHPHTSRNLIDHGMQHEYTQAIFQDFFTSLLQESHAVRIMDIYTLEGSKVLFRFGVALIVLYQQEWKEKYCYNPNQTFWEGLVEFGQKALNFEILVKKAYGVHGKGVRKRFRFPRRPILARIIQLEETRYWRETRALQNGTPAGEAGGIKEVVPPLGLVVPKPPTDPNKEREVPKLTESTYIRTKLAEWLPLSLRFTKLDMIYSTDHHGRTLEQFYHRVKKSRHTILVLEPFDNSSTTNTPDMVIGMYASQTWHASTKVYGDGSCFLFRIVPENDELTACWKWHPKELSSLEEENNDSNSGINAAALLEQFQVSTREFISMGGNSDGTSGLRLNEDFTKAESAPAEGFDNDSLFVNQAVDSRSSLFEVGLVEVYQMVRQMDGVAIQ